MSNKNTTAQTKKKMIATLRAHMGVVKNACEEVGISRVTHYNYLKNDPEYKEAVESIGEEAVDVAESKLHELIMGVKVEGKDGVYDRPPCKSAIIFYLKTKGKNRGYIERSETDMRLSDDSVVWNETKTYEADKNANEGS